MTDPTKYVVKGINGFKLVDFSKWETVDEELKKATEITAEEVLEAVRETDISLVYDSDPDEWCVSHMHGRDLTLELLAEIK
jgi:hypothetical protein